jgi:hypothetical protein
MPVCAAGSACREIARRSQTFRWRVDYQLIRCMVCQAQSDLQW